jgi:hypothetical protein
MAISTTQMLGKPESTDSWAQYTRAASPSDVANSRSESQPPKAEPKPDPSRRATIICATEALLKPMCCSHSTPKESKATQGMLPTTPWQTSSTKVRREQMVRTWARTPTHSAAATAAAQPLRRGGSSTQRWIAGASSSDSAATTPKDLGKTVAQGGCLSVEPA